MNNSKAENERLFKKRIKELSKIKGWGTELISLYIPPEKNLAEVTNYLKREYSQASNIKDKITNKNVRACIKTIMQRLKTINKPPKNGLAIFCGAIPTSNSRGTEKIEIFLIEPIMPIKAFIYRCGGSFFLEPLEKMVLPKEIYGFIVIDREKAVIGLIKDVYVQLLGKYTSGAPGKHSKGGQSQQRFNRLREKIILEYFRRVGEHAASFFRGTPNLKGIIIGGPGFAKQDFLKADALPSDLENKVVGLIDIGYGGEEGVRELVSKVGEVLSGLVIVKEKKLVQDFFKKVVEEPNLVTYGFNNVFDALRREAVATLLLSENLSLYRVKLTCRTCGYIDEKILNGKEINEIVTKGVPCPKCNSPLYIEEEKDLFEELIEEAGKHNAEVFIVSAETEEGKQFASAFNGAGALLKYPLI